jgi:hypothetical protein
MVPAGFSAPSQTSILQDRLQQFYTIILWLGKMTKADFFLSDEHKGLSSTRRRSSWSYLWSSMNHRCSLWNGKDPPWSYRCLQYQALTHRDSSLSHRRPSWNRRVWCVWLFPAKLPSLHEHTVAKSAFLWGLPPLPFLPSPADWPPFQVYTVSHLPPPSPHF